jgi:predicted anti-sigma-YlaC factor YlaD
MECTDIHEILSAVLDGEATAEEQRQLTHHMTACASCRSLASDIGDLHRAMRIAPAPNVPDLTEAIIAATAPTEREPRRQAVLRTLMVVCGAVLLTLSLPDLLGGTGMHARMERHLGAFDFALAAGLLFTAWRPQRSLSGFLPIASVLVAVCIFVTLSDHTMGLDLATHMSSLVGISAAWMLEALITRHGQARRLRLA